MRQYCKHYGTLSDVPLHPHLHIIFDLIIMLLQVISHIIFGPFFSLFM